MLLSPLTSRSLHLRRSPVFTCLRADSQLAEHGRKFWQRLGCRGAKLPSHCEPTKTLAAHWTSGGSSAHSTHIQGAVGLAHELTASQTSYGNDFTRALSTTTLSTLSVTRHLRCTACTDGGVPHIRLHHGQGARSPQSLMPTRSHRYSGALRYSTSVKAQLTRKGARRSSKTPAKAQDPNAARNRR